MCQAYFPALRQQDCPSHGALRGVCLSQRRACRSSTCSVLCAPSAQHKGATSLVRSRFGRAEVRTLASGGGVAAAHMSTLGSSSGSLRAAILDLTLTDGAGAVPTAAAVSRACEAAGGVAADELDPMMAAVAGVGGAAAAAATALWPQQQLQQQASGTTMLHGPSGLRNASVPALAAGNQPPRVGARGPLPTNGDGQGRPPAAPVNAVAAVLNRYKFQYAVSGSLGDTKVAGGGQGKGRSGPLGAHMAAGADRLRA
jgi:hypothetical protein